MRPVAAIAPEQPVRPVRPALPAPIVLPLVPASPAPAATSLLPLMSLLAAIFKLGTAVILALAGLVLGVYLGRKSKEKNKLDQIKVS
jgi:hypothetical protein